MIYLVDYIGMHCGMHYYLEAFREVLEWNDGVKVGIVSNFNDEGDSPVFLNHYKGNKLQKAWKAWRNVRRLKRFVKSHPEDKFIYLTYGTVLDPMFLNAVTAAPNHCIDIHEAIAQNEEHNSRLAKSLASIYRDKVKNVISHSERTDNFLNGYGYRGKTYHVPHFKYVFPKEFNSANVAYDIRESVDDKKINLLFFGNLTREKGVDILIEAINLLDDETAAKYNVVIAGKDRDGSCDRVRSKCGRKVHLIKRHISDDELRYLYAHTDLLALPYRKTSQSGILEMAFYFKKPIVASDIPYFRKMLSDFPSFGLLAGKGAREYSHALEEYASNPHCGFFEDDHYARYENRAEVAEFMKDFKSWLD